MDAAVASSALWSSSSAEERDPPDQDRPSAGPRDEAASSRPDTMAASRALWSSCGLTPGRAPPRAAAAMTAVAAAAGVGPAEGPAALSGCALGGASD